MQHRPCFFSPWAARPPPPSSLLPAPAFPAAARGPLAGHHISAPPAAAVKSVALRSSSAAPRSNIAVRELQQQRRCLPCLMSPLYQLGVLAPTYRGSTCAAAFGCKHSKLNLNRNHLPLAVPIGLKNGYSHGKLTISRAQSEDSKGGGGFLAGFLIGGAVFGTLGYVFAPQISKTLDSLLDENGQESESDEQGLQRPRYGRYYDEGLEKTRQTLGDKISQLNLAIDKAASRLRRVTGNVEKESAKDETEVEPS